MLRLRVPRSLLRVPVRAVHSSPPRCPSCSSPLPTALPACPTCSYIAAIPVSTSFYEVFQLSDQPNPFRVDVAKLRASFRHAQSVCHPDSWAAKGVDKKDVALSLSTFVNAAYQGLARPLSRAEYILERNGYRMSETDQLEDLDFISEVMEARETLEEAKNKKLVEQVARENDLKVEGVLRELDEFVGKKEWEAVKAAAIRLKYLQGIKHTALEKLRDL